MKRNVKWVVELKDLSDNIISGLLEFGTVDIIAPSLNIALITTNSGMKDSILKCNGVIKIERDTQYQAI